MGYRENYEYWLSDPYFDEETKKELASIKDDDNEIQEVDYDKSPDKRPKKKKKKEKPEKKSHSGLTDQQTMLQRINDFLAGRSNSIQLE